MTAPSDDLPDDNLRDRLCEIGRYNRVSLAHEHGLVILAMGVPYWLVPNETGGYAILVEEQYEEAVREQVEKYDRENRYWPPAQDWLPSGTGTGWSIALYLLLIWGLFLNPDDQLVALGSASEELIHSGEWWRVITALTLHADAAHIIGNSFGGLLFFGLVFRYLGHGLAWFLILAAGALGNLFNAWGYAGAGHNSIGASTAVFGALGITVGFRLFRQFRLTGWHWPRHLWVPLGGGLVLLGFLGAGGERTDVLAHWWGFIVGAALGGLAGFLHLDKFLKERRIQNVMALLTIASVIGAWFVATR